MDFAKHGSLVAALLYVVAVGTLLAGQSPAVPQPVLNSLELRPLLLLGRMIEPPDLVAAAPAGAGEGKSPWVPAGDGVQPGRPDLQGGEWEELALMLRAGLESVAHKPLGTREDPLRAAAVAAGLGARHLVPPFAGPLAAGDPAAAVLVRWAFDPAAPASDADLAALRGAGLPPPLCDMAVAAVAQAAGRVDDAAAARASWVAAADEVRGWASLATLVFGTALIVGTVLWFRMRRLQWEAMAVLRPRPTLDSLLPVARVLAYFMAVYLTIGVFGPDLLEGVEIPGGVAGMATLIYLVTAAAGIFVVLSSGRSGAREPAADLLGLRTMALSRVPAGAAWGVAGWCMLVPAVMSATFFAATLLGIGGNPFDNPVAMLLAMDPAPEVVALLLLSTVVLAPLFEETLFRGFLHGRLRRHFTPYGAAAISGLLFAVAHLSVSNLLPLWALGFALGILYDRTRTLWAPMVAHALWNLGTAGVLLTLFS